MSTNKPTLRHDAYAALRIPEYRAYILSRYFLFIGLQIQGIVVGWQLYELTGSKWLLGLVGLAEAVPALTVSLFAGYVADHYPRKRIAVACILLLIGSSSFLLAYAYNIATWYPAYGVLPFFVAIAINGFARGFYSPAAYSLMTDLIPSEIIVNAASWNSVMWEIANVTGPAIGGYLFAFGGATVSYSVVVVSMLGCFGSFLFVRDRVRVRTEARPPMLGSIVEGWRYLFRNHTLFGALSLDMFAVFFGGAVALLPVFAKDILHTDAAGLGLLRAAPSVGAILAAAVLTYRPPMQYAGRNLFIVVAGFGLATIGFGLSTNFYLSLFFLFLTGITDSVSVVIRSSVLQLYVPEQMRGRVQAVNSMFTVSSNEIGTFESGATAAMLGTVPAVVFGGVMTIVTVLVVYRIAPSLRALTRLEPMEA